AGSTPPPAQPTSAARTRRFSAGFTCTTATAPKPWSTATAADAPPFCPKASRADRPGRGNHRPRTARIARPRLDGQEAQAVGLADVRPAGRAKHHPPSLAFGRPDVEEGQEAAGQSQAGEAGRPRPGTAEAVHPSL